MALLSTVQAARLCRVEPATVRSWAHRGLIQPAGLDDRRRPLYDQLTIARAEAATRAKAGRQVAGLAA